MFKIDRLMTALEDLNIHNLLPDVLDHVVTQKGVAVISASTSSGKTLVTPAALAAALKKQVVVIEPRRYLAINAAETVCELGGFEMGESVSYAVGIQGRGEALPFRHADVVYTTSGYALSSKMIMTGNVFILDEFHEKGLDMSICQALLHKRMMDGEDITLIIMSATINGDTEIAYWPEHTKAKCFTYEGKRYECKRIHNENLTVAEGIIELIQSEGRKGVLGFIEGRGEIAEQCDLLEKLAAELNLKLDISIIHGESDREERMASTRPLREGYDAKVLLGTNVIESGVNFRWTDGGVSSGRGKQLEYTPNGGSRLMTRDLPQWRLIQQEGRTNRFQDGVFMLTGDIPWDKRDITTEPEIKRVPLTALVMHCASLGISPDDLVFESSLDKYALADAQDRLEKLGFIKGVTVVRKGMMVKHYDLTPDGEFAARLPVGIEASALLAHARKIGFLEHAIIPAAVLDVGGVRKSYKVTHLMTQRSDVLDGSCAYVFAMMLHADKELRYVDRKAKMEMWNIGHRKCQAAKDVIVALQKVLDVRYDITLYKDHMAHDGQRDRVLMGKLGQCLAAAYALNMHGRIFEDRRGQQMNMTQISHGSVNLSPVYNPYSGDEPADDEIICGSGVERVITPRNGYPFTVMEQVSGYTLQDLLDLKEVRPDLVTVTRYGTREVVYVLGKEVFTQYHLTPDDSPVKEEAVGVSQAMAYQMAAKAPDDAPIDNRPMSERLAELQSAWGRK